MLSQYVCACKIQQADYKIYVKELRANKRLPEEEQGVRWDWEILLLDIKTYYKH